MTFSKEGDLKLQSRLQVTGGQIPFGVRELSLLALVGQRTALSVFYRSLDGQREH